MGMQSLPLELLEYIKSLREVPTVHTVYINSNVKIPCTMPISFTNHDDDRKNSLPEPCLIGGSLVWDSNFVEPEGFVWPYDDSYEFIWDGKNKEGLSLCAASYSNDYSENRHDLCISSKGVPQEFNWDKFDFSSHGRVTALLLQDTNRFVCCVDRYQNSISSNRRRQHKEGFRMNIVDIGPNKTFKQVAGIHWDKNIKKTIFLDGEYGTYLGLASDGSLISFWLADNNKPVIEWKNQTLINYNKEKMPIKDIDADRSIKTTTGFMPRIAFLEKSGKLYVADLSYIGKTLHYVCTIPDVEHSERLVYDNGICSVLYKEKMDGETEPIFTKAVHFSDNFSLIYAHQLMKKIIAQAAIDNAATV